MMKKNSIMFMLLLITSTILFACSNDEDFALTEENEVGKLIPVSQEENDIQDFFSRSLPAFGSGGTPLFLLDSEKDCFCVCLNSMKGIQDIYLGDETIPLVDFEHYTLILGKVPVPDTSCELDSNEVVLYETHAELNLTVKRGTSAFPAFMDLYFWALYPKFDREITTINLIVK